MQCRNGKKGDCDGLYEDYLQEPVTHTPLRYNHQSGFSPGLNWKVQERPCIRITVVFKKGLKESPDVCWGGAKFGLQRSIYM